MSARLAANSARCAAEVSQASLRFLTTLAGDPTAMEKSGISPFDDGVRAKHATAANRGAAQNGDLGGDPGVGADPHRGLDDALVLDRHLDVVHLVVEVAHVAPIGHQRRLTELDVEVAVDDVVPAENHLVTQPQRAFVRPDGVLVPDVHPAADLQLRQFRCGVDLDSLAEEHHSAGDDVRVGQLELEQPPVPDQVPRRVCTVGDDPLQRGFGEKRASGEDRAAATRASACVSARPTWSSWRTSVTTCLTASLAWMGRAPVRLIAVMSVAALTGLTAACGNTDSWVDSSAARGWPAQYADAANRSYTPTAGATTLALQWTRSVKGELGAAAALGGDGYLAVNGQTAGGCSLMVWRTTTTAANGGAPGWCWAEGSPVRCSTGFDNLFIGQPGLMLSYPPTQWVRLRTPVIGMPTTARFLDHGQLLVVTHLGQTLVFDSHRGT